MSMQGITSLVRKLAGPALAVVALMAQLPEALADDYETVRIEPGATVDVYWNVNLSGRV